MNQIDPRTRENPEAAMLHAELTPAQLNDCLKNPYTKDRAALHQPSAAFFDIPWPFGPSDGEIREASARRDLGIDLHSLINAGEVPGFDSEAHRSFMRSLG